MNFGYTGTLNAPFSLPGIRSAGRLSQNLLGLDNYQLQLYSGYAPQALYQNLMPSFYGSQATLPALQSSRLGTTRLAAKPPAAEPVEAEPEPAGGGVTATPPSVYNPPSGYRAPPIRSSFVGGSIRSPHVSGSQYSSSPFYRGIR